MMVDDLPHSNLYTRLKVSRHGLGVFAIRAIPGGMRLFEGENVAVVRVPRATVDEIEDAEVRQMYFDFCPLIEDAYVAPVNFNQLTMCWYMNHSPEANVHVDGDLEFTAARQIAPGEELTTNYSLFSGQAPAIVAQWTASE